MAAAMTKNTGLQEQAGSGQQIGGCKERFPNYLRSYGAQAVYGVLAANRNTDAYRSFSIFNSGR